jgi:flavin reductase (DIM6/NTAB) family NADH-FMN oxidoreductase RutF
MPKLEWKPGTLLSPVPPALVSCGTLERPNLFTVAWTGIVCSDPPKAYISVRPERYSYDLIKNSGEFVINLPTAGLVRDIDFCGVRSGRDIDKIEATGLKISPSFQVAAPTVNKSPLSLECRVSQIIPLGSHDMFLADIVAVGVEEQLVDAKGKLHLEGCRLVGYAHGEYFELGQKLGSFGYSIRKKPVSKRKR